MRAESSQRPQPYRINICGADAVIKFAVNITAKQMDTDNGSDNQNTETVYEYDTYSLITKNRAGLEDDISSNLERWTEKARQEEIDSLSANIRAQRDALLADTDKDFALDRIDLNIPDKVTTSTLLGAVKDIFAVLGSVCNSEMAKYRQALRDIPQQEGFPYDVRFPSKPQA